jgi:hypothetical protein
MDLSVAKDHLDLYVSSGNGEFKLIEKKGESKTVSKRR